jgi:hyperosmotically inducible protein
MNSELSHKIIVAIGLAAVVGMGAVTFALRSHPATSVAQISHPPTSVAQVSDAPASGAQVSEAPAPVAQISDAPPPVAPRDSVGAATGDTVIPAAVEPKIAGDRHLAKARISVGTSNSTATRNGSAVKSSEKPAAETLANTMDGVKSGDEPTMPSAASRMPADAQEGVTSTWPATSDSSITTEVKSEISADSVSRDIDIGVTTTNGVVVLTGTLATQDAIEHVKDVAEKVKDVKSVDISALKISNT